MKLKAKPGRGDLDAEFVINSMIDDWAVIREGLASLSEEEKDALKEYFNTLFEGSDIDDTGDLLFSEDSDDFKSGIGYLGE